MPFTIVLNYIRLHQINTEYTAKLNTGPFGEEFVVGKGISKLATETHMAITSYNKHMQNLEGSVHACL